MRNIVSKIETLRTARAEARVKMREETLQLLREGKGPKGDPLPLARAAAVMAAKKTSDLIPYCHPILIDHVGVDFELPSPQPSPAGGEGVLVITTEVSAVAKTGVEMEALTAASVAALTIYDMLKPVDDQMEILGCRLIEKKGGKSSFPAFVPKGFKAAILVMSDTISSEMKLNQAQSAVEGEAPRALPVEGATRAPIKDRSGRLIRERLTAFGIENVEPIVLPDDREKIRNELLRLCEDGTHLILTTGGTGLGPRDVTVEATREVIERDIPGISEAMRSYGQRRTPYAMLSRGLVGIRGKTMIVNLPGSSKGVVESMDAIFPALFHAYPMTEGEGH